MQPLNDVDTDVLDTAVLVSMWDGQVVICPPPRPDIEATEILIDAAAHAVESGATVMIDLDPATPSGDLIPLGLPGGSPTDVRSEAGPVTVLGPGIVRLRTGDSHWTIDLMHSRMVRTEKPVDPAFVSADRWTHIRALWATCHSVRALTTEGSYLTTLVAWTVSSQRIERRRSVRSSVSA